ncbi:NUDIX hydrolase [Candidatus Aerophobetes bacterium]|nr:NUDIX hydrolase [Candidatus Aerophobetes bacterium]
MPEIGFCICCGENLERKLIEEEERTRLVCKNCGYIHYQNPLPVVVAVLTRPEQRVVGVIKRAIAPREGKWALVGGFMEIDEQPEEAILREVREEIGVEGKVRGLINVHSDKSGLYHKVVVIGYEVVITESTFLPGKEVKEFKFFPLCSLPPLAFPSHGKILKDFEKTYRNPFPTVDAIVEKNGGIILVKRKNSPHGWALPGGFVDYGETLEEAIRREIKEETNLEIDNLYQFHTYSEPGRDPRFHTISTVFVVRARGKLKAGDDAENVRIFSENDLPQNIAFDHGKIIKDYLELRKIKK